MSRESARGNGRIGDGPPQADGELQAETCLALEREAGEFVTELRRGATCSSDEDCVLADEIFECTGTTVCGIVLNRAGPTADQQRRISEFMGRYYQADCGCSKASCAGVDPVCDPGTKRCIGRKEGSDREPGNDDGGAFLRDASTSLLDARVVDPADAAPAMDATVSPYACKQASDCAIRNVGNCCGYYPRCVNANAILTPPDCSGGMGGVCGFPEISSCDCRNEQCVSLQNGNPL